jgi:hypothetical protein
MRLLTVAFLLAFVAAACGDSTGNQPAGTGILRLQLTDAPFPSDSVKSVDIHVVRVDARLAESDSGEAARGAGDDSASTGGWQTVARPNASFDLLKLRNGAFAAIGEDTLPAGVYRGFRLVIDPSKSGITLKDGMVLTGTSDPSVTFPSASRTGIKIVLTQGITVGEDSTSTLRIDFDLDNSFVMRGNSIRRNGLLFKPVVKANAVAPTP